MSSDKNYDFPIPPLHVTSLTHRILLDSIPIINFEVVIQIHQRFCPLRTTLLLKSLILKFRRDHS